MNVAEPTIRLVTDFDAVLAPIPVDRNQFELALLNLAINARDAMPPGAHLIDLIVTARSERIESSDVAGLKPGEYLRVGVKDTGGGMDEATLRCAAEPFKDRRPGYRPRPVDGARLHRSVRRRYANKRPAKHRYQCRVPASGNGGCPDGQAETGAGIIGRVAGGNTRSLRVLVVDDNLMVGAGTGAMIEDLGHAAIEVASAAGALEVLRSELDIDIVITDNAMPEMNGSELATEIRRIRSHMPVVMATGYAGLPRALGQVRRGDGDRKTLAQHH